MWDNEPFDRPAGNRHSRDRFDGPFMTAYDRFVPIPNAGGRCSAQILPDPNALLDLKWRMGWAIKKVNIQYTRSGRRLNHGRARSASYDPISDRFH